ncbi:hypothetical protein FD12_GL001142 [Lentilactobacillus rapi DSM 19907 = JCM 15042]|nr:hypothetical protein FD12_GL001142 [Lentilactobacillus rapi DSM 19907 = JCM 15042]
MHNRLIKQVSGGNAMRVNILDHYEYAAIRDNATQAIQEAIDACHAFGNGTVIVPSGTYVINGITLKSHVTLNLMAGATLIGSGDESQYIFRPGPFELNANQTPISGLITAKGQHNIAIVGEGTIDGNYQKFVLPNQPKALHLKFYKYPRPMTVYFEDCTNVILKGITIQNAPFWTVHLVGCLNTEAARLTIHNEKRMPNTDGFDIDRSKNTVIHDCEIITGDDAICPKCTEETARYGDCTGLIVTNCRITTQSAAVKFGSSSFGNFVNCQFSNLTIEDTNRGLAFQLRDPGSVENILFENITIKTKHYSKDWWGSGEPIFISILPRDNQTDLTGQRIRNVIFKNIQCDAENGVFIGSAADGMITNVLFDHVEIRLRKALAAATEFDLRPWKGVAKVGAKLAGINSVHSNHYSLQNFRVTDIGGHLWNAQKEGQP